MTEDPYAEAIARFRDLLERARATDLREPTAVSLATADADGRPTCRTVLLKLVDERGFVFFTNFQSRKGRQLEANPRAALCFFWQPLFEQVLVEGRVDAVDGHEADEYWRTRDRDSQLGAWASEQSQTLPDRATLETRLREHHDRFKDDLVPRPPHWSGFRVVPDRIEFWRSGWHRLHERVCYEREGDGPWHVRLLFP